MDIHRLNQKAAAELLGVTTRTLREWADAPRNADNSYDGTALVRWLVQREAGVELDPVRERARKDKELADKYAAENAVRRGELYEVATVESQWSALVLACRSRLLRLPTDCAADAPADMRSAVQATVKRAVHEALHELSRWPEAQGRA